MEEAIQSYILQCRDNALSLMEKGGVVESLYVFLKEMELNDETKDHPSLYFIKIAIEHPDLLEEKALKEFLQSIS